MVSDYEAIKRANVERYGTDIGRIGPMLLANRYDDRTHFIFELLQNAEDAHKRRKNKAGPRSIEFHLTQKCLFVTHSGEPFTDADVRGICGIGESTKAEDLTTIGRFGIGFKAVYAFTDSPEIHSGSEHFSIDSFVWPRSVKPTGTKKETLFLFPFRDSDVTAFTDISAGLKKLGARTLLFLREINEISWKIEGGPKGIYLRSESQKATAAARYVTVIGEETGRETIEENWLLFEKPVHTEEGVEAGHVELAFNIVTDKSGKRSVQRISDSTIVVFFPTIVTTNVGFLIQGPYRTTPSRDNIPRQDPWNQTLVVETGKLLANALVSLKNLGLMNTELLRALPLDPTKFGEGAMLAPLFDHVSECLTNESILPCVGGKYAPAQYSALARSQELHELLSPEQLGCLFPLSNNKDNTVPRFWLTEDITQNRTPELRQYLMSELEIEEIDPVDFVRALSTKFFEQQTDEWITRFYRFIAGQQRLWETVRIFQKAIFRLDDGVHVPHLRGGQIQVFLPTSVKTGFPTIKRSVCQDQDALKFLVNFGITAPDPVDDVIRNILPAYSEQNAKVSEEKYVSDIARIVIAFKTDSKSRKDVLVAALRQNNFVMSIDIGVQEQ